MNTDRLKGYFRAYSDWIAIGAVVFLVLSIALFAFLLRPQSEPRLSNRTLSGFEEKTYAMEAPDPAYPAPAKEQRALSVLYTEGYIQYSVTWTNRNVVRNPVIGSHSFTVELYNSANKDVTLDSDMLAAVTIGCIAMDNPYRTVPVEVQSLSFTPYEKKKIEFGIDVSCMYLGTADSKYFWRIY